MRVLLVSQYFPPELTAASPRMHSFAAGLARRGHEVEVICEVPNHPTGVVREGYGGRLVDRRELDGFEVRYVWVRRMRKPGVGNRILNYGSYAAMALGNALRARRPDVVLVTSPPLPAAAAASTAARMRRVPWVLDVRDIWPEAAVAVGELSPGRVVRALERLERRLYRGAGGVVTVTEPFREHIAARVDDPGKVTVIPNGTTREWLDAGEEEVSRAEAGLPEGGFVLTYCGNLGLAQGLDAAVKAARLAGESFHLELIGDGPKADELRELAADVPNVAFRGMLPLTEAARVMRASDALLVPLADRAELAKFVPSKLFDGWAVGRPVIVAAAGEAARLTEDAGAGVSVPPGDPAALADAMRELAADDELRERLGAAARRAGERSTRDAGVERLEQVLKTAAARG